MKYKFTIRGTLPSLNDYISAERSNRFQGAGMKKQCEGIVMHAARKFGKLKIERPVYMVYRWYEPNGKRDMDNISSFGRKIIQDALVKSGILQNDGWKNIIGFEDKFEIDRKIRESLLRSWRLRREKNEIQSLRTADN